MATAIILDFALVVCRRCAFWERVAGFPCANCGDPGRPGEVNANVVRRRQGVRAIRTALEEQGADDVALLPFYLTHDLWRNESSARLEETLAAIAVFSRSPMEHRTQSSVIAALAGLRKIECDLADYAIRRPFVSELLAMREASGCLNQMAERYLSACEAATPAEAQDMSRLAQIEIDKAIQHFDGVDSERTVGKLLETATPDQYVRASIDALALVYPEQNLLEVDMSSRIRLAKRLGREVAAGQGASYEIAMIVARTTLSASRFESIVVECSRLFNDSSGLQEIADEDGSVSVLLRARMAIVDSIAAFAVALDTATTDELRLRRVMNLYRELFEEAGQPLFAWYLRVFGAKTAPMSKLMRDDSTGLLAAIRRHPDLARIFEGADSNIRTAASHGHSYELVGADVTFSTRSFNGIMTVEVLIDLLFAMIESLLAALWVLDNELAVIGVDDHMSTSSLLGAPLLDIAVEVLRNLGVPVRRANLTGVGWRIELGIGGRLDSHGCAAALSASPIEGVQEIAIVCAHLPPGDLRVPQSASEPFSSAAAESNMALLAANLRLLSVSTLDGGSVITEDHLRWTASAAGVALLTSQALEAVGVLRECLRIAQKLAADDVRAFVQMVLSEWRSRSPDRSKEIRKTVKAWSILPNPTLPKVGTTTITDLR